MSVCVGTQCVPGVAACVVAKIYRPHFFSHATHTHLAYAVQMHMHYAQACACIDDCCEEASVSMAEPV